MGTSTLTPVPASVSVSLRDRTAEEPVKIAVESLNFYYGQKRALEGLRLLAESGRVLSSSLDVEETLQAIAHLAVPGLAEMVMVDVIEGDAIRRVSASHAESRLGALFQRSREFPPRPRDGGPQAP